MGQIDITFDKSVGDQIQRIADKLPQAIMEFLDDVASSVEVLMKDEAPVVLGDLQNSITTDNISPLERLIWPSMFYAPFVILGTRPHIIEGKPWLYWEGADHPVRVVNHPGTQPNDFPGRAAERADSIIEDRLDGFYRNLFE